MRKLTTRLAIALLTFSIGIVSANLWITRRARQTEEVLPPAPAVAEPPIMEDVSEGWRKVDVEGKFSFYLPPNMEEVLPPNHPEADRVFRRRKTAEDEFLYLYYAYGRQGSCDRDANLSSAGVSQKSEVVISGKRAMLNIWQPELGRLDFSLSQLPKMKLCFPDVGRGKAKLYLYTTARDLKSLEVAKQIFNSIEFY